MRRTIRLTGRKQLPVSCANVNIRDVGERKLVTLAIADPAALRGFPRSARIKLKLVENKQMELLDFGTIGEPKSAAELQNATFEDPSCQVRIADTGNERHGVLLGSTKQWRLLSDKQPEQGGSRGILRFLPKDIAPRVWKLDMQEDAHPIVLVDERIPNVKSWVKNNAVFVSAVLPAILQSVFSEILATPEPADIQWMSDWLRWAEALMPGYPAPKHDSDEAERSDWIERLVDTFCERHRLSDKLVSELVGQEAK
jgi:hypothetical protein